MATTTRLITLLTDFGLRDSFVAAMKGVMLGVNPDLAFVDISHLVSPHDIHSGAFTLAQAYSYFPLGTIHVAVVDPGVGTARKALVVSAGGHFFVAPDNGILTYVLDREDGFVAHEIAADHYFRKPVSSTFHGRDIFAPVAAWLSRDITLPQFGPELKQPARLQIPAVTRVRDALVQGAVLAVDNFGNLVTNLKPDDVPVYGSTGNRACKVVAGQREITIFKRSFGEGARGELFVIPGSSGYLEIVMRDRSAAAELHLGPGAPVGVIFG
ncbi:MAG: SAM-dependent chlorinase/fluorinase [Acidobacteriia bacterium]|nr:SAM-dependent chlorinase/fluorinase [Terriglobia bacterium]